MYITPCIMCVQYIGGGGGGGQGVQYTGGYHEYIGGCSVHWGDIMMHLGEQGDKRLSIYIENPNVLNISQCTEHLPMY